MKLDVTLAGSVKLRVQIYDGDGEPELDGWELVEVTSEFGADGTRRTVERVVDCDPAMERFLESEFARWGIDAFQLGALYRMQLEEEPSCVA